MKLVKLKFWLRYSSKALNGWYIIIIFNLFRINEIIEVTTALIRRPKVHNLSRYIEWVNFIKLFLKEFDHLKLLCCKLILNLMSKLLKHFTFLVTINKAFIDIASPLNFWHLENIFWLLCFFLLFRLYRNWLGSLFKPCPCYSFSHLFFFSCQILS